MQSKYPLEALEKLREARADDCISKLGGAEATVRRAAAQLADAEGAVNRAREAALALERANREQLEQGSARALDLSLAADCARAAEAERQRLAQAERAARNRLHDAERLRASAADAVGKAKAELSSLERHREGWALDCQREREDGEEEAALERWNAARFGPGRH